MKLEQDLIQRKRDGKWEVWQLLSVRWDNPNFWLEMGTYGQTWQAVAQPEWVLAGVFSSRDAAIRFWNASFLAANDRAPAIAGDGFGSSGVEIASMSDHLRA